MSRYPVVLPYLPYPRCPKCGEEKPRYTYKAGIRSGSRLLRVLRGKPATIPFEHIALRCGRCGYTWRMRPKKAPGLELG